MLHLGLYLGGSLPSHNKNNKINKIYGYVCNVLWLVLCMELNGTRPDVAQKKHENYHSVAQNGNCKLFL